MRSIPTADGTNLRFFDEGAGPVVLIIGPGLDDGTRTGRLSAALTDRFRVIRLRRRRYRTDLVQTGGPCSVADEVGDVLTIVRTIGEPVLLYGHSSGGVVALESLAATPEAFAGAVIFEPSVVVDAPLGGPDSEVVRLARSALAAGRPGRAMANFLRATVELPSWLAGALTALVPRYRRLVPGQIDDLEALDRLGRRLEVYAEIKVPTVLLGGSRSPAHLAARIAAIAELWPAAERVVLPGLDHGADLKAAGTVAGVIRAFADRTINTPPR